MSVWFVDGPDGTGKTGVSRYLADEFDCLWLSMNDIDDLSGVEKRAETFNETLVQIHDQGYDFVVDRGSVSSIVYSEVYDRGRPEHAWKALYELQPTIVYLTCDPDELVIRHVDPLVDEEHLRRVAGVYQDTMEFLDDEGFKVITIDTTTDILRDVKDLVRVTGVTEND